jgi:hypothetical protein
MLINLSADQLNALCRGDTITGTGFTITRPTLEEAPLIRTQALAGLMDAGLQFSSVVQMYNDGQGRAFDAVIDQARQRHHVEGEVEIDDFPIISESGDNGTYVSAWVWVPNPQPEVADEDDEAQVHEDGDGCAIYDTGYQVRYNEGESTIDAEDLSPGDTYNDPASDDSDTWYDVVAVVVIDDQVHVESEGSRD